MLFIKNVCNTFNLSQLLLPWYNQSPHLIQLEMLFELLYMHRQIWDFFIPS